MLCRHIFPKTKSTRLKKIISFLNNPSVIYESISQKYEKSLEVEISDGMSSLVPVHVFLGTSTIQKSNQRTFQAIRVHSQFKTLIKKVQQMTGYKWVNLLTIWEVIKSIPAANFFDFTKYPQVHAISPLEDKLLYHLLQEENSGIYHHRLCTPQMSIFLALFLKNEYIGY